MFSRRAFGLLAAASAAFPHRSSAQEIMDEPQLFLKAQLYLPEYISLKTRADAGDADAKAMLAQHAALVGDEASATAYGGSRSPIPDALELRAEPAIQAIVERARDKRIVILNENHSISRHRAFTAQVLTALRPLGFEILAAETFVWKGYPSPSYVEDLRPNQPILPSYGYYLRDPVYAETVRRALQLGYRLAGYEITSAQRDRSKSASRIERITEREEAQSQNLIDHVLTPNPDSRILVICGHSHVLEEPDGDLEWFASRLKRASGIDPLTIEQSFNYPAVDPTNDPTPTRAVLQRLSPTEPVAVFETSGQPFTLPPFSGRIDLSIFHPRMPDVYGRPGWLANDPARRPAPVSFKAETGLSLIQAIPAAETMAAIPADHCLVQPGQTEATLYLRPGSYIIRLETDQTWQVVGSLEVAP